MGRILNALIGPPLEATPEPPRVLAAARVELAATSGILPPRWGIGGEYLQPVEWNGAMSQTLDRAAAMSVPSIARSRDLICSAVGALPLTLWSVATLPDVEQIMPPVTWMGRPDPNRTRQWQLAWTVDDLFFYACAYWLITSRLATSFPSSFRRLDPARLTIETDGTVRYDETWGEVVELDPVDVVEFLSPLEGVLQNGWRAISIALQLDQSAERFAGNEVPAGVLEEQEGGEDLSADELADQAARFTLARRNNTTAATNKYVKYREVNYDPGKMQLVESRGYQALEMARLGDVPPYLIGAPAGTGMTYQNTAQARADLIDFGAMPYIGCIEQTLSGPNVTPRGQVVRLDTNAWLRNPLTPNDGASPNDLQIAVEPGTLNTPAPSTVPAP